MTGLKITFIIGFLFLYNSGSARAENEEWHICTVDSDCVIVGAGCAVAAVNKLYQTEAHTYYAQKNSMMDCEPSIRPETSKAVCVHRKTTCKKLFGLMDDHESTCVSATKACTIAPKS